MKHRWKKAVSGIVAAALMIPCMSVIHITAQEEIRVLVAGEQVEFDQPPVLRNDRVLVPLRAVGEALGCEVHWYENTQSIGIGRNGNGLDDVVLKVGYPRVLSLTDNNVVEKVTEIDQPPIVENDRTLVPVRALAEAVGAEVRWEEATQTVTVTPWNVNPDLIFQDGIAILKQGRYSSVQKEDGTMLLPGQYDRIVRYGDMLVADVVSYVAKWWQTTVYDLDGNVLMAEKTDAKLLYVFGYLSVSWTERTDKAWWEEGSSVTRHTVLDKTGKTVLENVDDETYQSFRREYFLLNVVETDTAGSSQSGLVRATVSKENGETRTIFMNEDCTEVAILHEFEKVWPFENGYAPFCERGRWGYIDTKGNVVIQPQYEEARAFSETVAPVKSGGVWGFVGKDGLEKVAPQYEEFYIAEDGTEMTVKKDGKWGLIDAQGITKIPFQFDTPFWFQEDMAVMTDGEKYGYIGQSGEWVIPAQFDGCRPFSGGVAVVSRTTDSGDENITEQYALIDKTGQLITEFGKYYIYGLRGVTNGYINVGFLEYDSSGILGVDGTEIECHQLIWP